MPHLARVVRQGRVRSVIGSAVEVEGLADARVGALCTVEPGDGRAGFAAEIVGFRDGRTWLMPLEARHGVAPGWRVAPQTSRAVVPAGTCALGRVLDGLGRPIDGGAPLTDAEIAPLHRAPEPALTRPRIAEPLDLGVRALNAFTTAGRGARLGIFAGSGVGKSTLLGQIARFTACDVAVIALIGERGREVREFLERDLGAGLERSAVVVATSDESAALRVRAAHAATAIAESFRDAGKHVLLLMDSLTRFCMALREIGLAAGEPPATRGYPPSMWSALPALVERAGTAPSGGSITGIYTVLVEGDDQLEPVADAARSLLDGHVVLTRELSERGHFPPIDVLQSVSRVMPDVTSDAHRGLAQRAREALATHRAAEDLIATGAYQSGSDPQIEWARRVEPPLRKLLRQPAHQRADLAASVASLAAVLDAGKAGAP
ncbi:MAG: EscN/YscN/HrcN family type III secretion system ATPase [Proteobacteria bacterium]|nr:MAG: EscN/YscN/HrcN family type III secretion system ATPase [Pseudomonadota bacterium]